MRRPEAVLGPSPPRHPAHRPPRTTSRSRREPAQGKVSVPGLQIARPIAKTPRTTPSAARARRAMCRSSHDERPRWKPTRCPGFGVSIDARSRAPAATYVRTRPLETRRKEMKKPLSHHNHWSRRGCARRGRRPAVHAQRNRRLRRRSGRRLMPAAPAARRCRSARRARSPRSHLSASQCSGARLAGTLFLPLTRRVRTPHRRLAPRQRRTTTALLWAACRLVCPRRDCRLLVRQARRWRVGGQLLSGRARPLQPRHRGRCRCSRSSTSSASSTGAGGLRRSERGGLDSAAGGGGVWGVAFVAIASAGVLRHGIVARFEQETGGTEGTQRALGSRDRVLESLRLRSHAVSRTPRRPGAVAVRRRRPQRAPLRARRCCTR